MSVLGYIGHILMAIGVLMIFVGMFKEFKSYSYLKWCKVAFAITMTGLIILLSIHYTK